MESRNKKVNDAYWYIGGGMALTSFVCQLVARHKLDKGLLAYNKHIGGFSSHDREAGKFGIGFSGDKVSILYYF